MAPSGKRVFRIGEAAALVGVPAHVLRYWEAELGFPRPRKTGGAHRHYRWPDIEVSLEIKRLVREEGLTLPGVRRRLEEWMSLRQDAPIAGASTRRDVDAETKGELRSLRALLASLVSVIEEEAPLTPLRVRPVPPRLGNNRGFGDPSTGTIRLLLPTPGARSVARH